MKKSEETTVNEELVGKNIDFYQPFVIAWVANRMEKDKSLLNLSALAIGLVMIFYDKLENGTQFILWLCSLLAFIFTIIMVLRILQKNSDYILEVIKDDNPTKKKDLETYLNKRDIISSILFVLGIVFIFVLGIIKSKFVLTLAITKI